MSTHGSCFRCERPIAVESGSELCLDCARTANTPGSTSLFPAAPESSLALLEQRKTRAEVPTETAITPPPRAYLPAAPAGYVLLDRIGSGGMGSVYLAREMAAERAVAMKFLHHPGRSGALDRFLVELRSFARLDHPNIVRVYGSDFLRSDPFFTMEYAAGGSLSRTIEENGPFAPAAAAQFMAAVTRAVHSAHAAGVIHRDLKPSNILLAADGSPKISDFGLAKRLDCDDGLTTASGPLGTPGYMAPEQVHSTSGMPRPTVDVYGLGATLYHLLTGRPPFRGPQPDILNEVLHRAPRPPRAVRPSIPRGLEAIVLKCLEKDPAARYPTAAALADDLDRFLAGLQPSAPVRTLRRRTIQKFHQNRRGIAWVGAVVMAAGAFVAALSVLIAPAPPAPDPAAEILREMTTGTTAVLLNDHRPRHAKWVVGHGEEFLPTPDAPEYAFYSNERAYLELCPDPGVDCYRFVARLKHLGTVGAVPTNHEVGLYTCYEARPGPNGSTAHTFNDVSYSDFPVPNKPSQKKRVEAHQSALVTAPLVHTKSLTVSTGSEVLEPVEKLPGLWRTFEIDVSPQRITVKCDGETISDSSRVGYYRGPAPVYRREFDKIALGGIPHPVFPSRGSLGVFVLGTGVAVKDLAISPAR